MSPFGHKQQPEQVSAKALILSPLYPTTGLQSVDLAIELSDGQYVFGAPTWSIVQYMGLLRVGAWFPIKVSPDDAKTAALDDALIPDADDVVAVVREALGGAKVDPVAPNEWRVGIAMQFAEQLISVGGVSAAQADAIRQRIGAGV